MRMRRSPPGGRPPGPPVPARAGFAHRPGWEGAALSPPLLFPRRRPGVLGGPSPGHPPAEHRMRLTPSFGPFSGFLSGQSRVRRARCPQRPRSGRSVAPPLAARPPLPAPGRGPPLVGEPRRPYHPSRPRSPPRRPGSLTPPTPVGWRSGQSSTRPRARCRARRSRRWRRAPASLYGK